MKGVTARSRELAAAEQRELRPAGDGHSGGGEEGAPLR